MKTKLYENNVLPRKCKKKQMLEYNFLNSAKKKQSNKQLFFGFIATRNFSKNFLIDRSTRISLAFYVKVK